MSQQLYCPYCLELIDPSKLPGECVDCGEVLTESELLTEDQRNAELDFEDEFGNDEE